jgi:hypothetical protein
MVLISVGAIILVVFIVWPFISASDVRRTIAGRWAEGSPIGCPIVATVCACMVRAAMQWVQGFMAVRGTEWTVRGTEAEKLRPPLHVLQLL